MNERSREHRSQNCNCQEEQVYKKLKINDTFVQLELVMARIQQRLSYLMSCDVTFAREKHLKTRRNRGTLKKQIGLLFGAK